MLKLCYTCRRSQYVTNLQKKKQYSVGSTTFLVEKTIIAKYTAGYQLKEINKKQACRFCERLGHGWGICGARARYPLLVLVSASSMKWDFEDHWEACRRYAIIRGWPYRTTLSRFCLTASSSGEAPFWSSVSSLALFSLASHAKHATWPWYAARWATRAEARHCGQGSFPSAAKSLASEDVDFLERNEPRSRFSNPLLLLLLLSSAMAFACSDLHHSACTYSTQQQQRCLLPGPLQKAQKVALLRWCTDFHWQARGEASKALTSK